MESESATLTFNQPLSYGTTYTVNLTNGVKDFRGDSVAALSASFTTQEAAYKIFVSNSSSPGNFDGGIAGADQSCNTDPKCLTLSGECKAILATKSTGSHARQAIPTNNWVLESYTAYVNDSGDLIGITGEPAADGTVPANPSVFAFHLSAAISSESATVWTGLNSEWTTAKNTCSDWTSGSTDVLGNIGNASATDSNSVFITESPAGSGYPSCDTPHNLYCVQVPH